MQDRQDEGRGSATIRTLIEVGRWVINATYLISAEKVGDPDPRQEVEVTLLPGRRFRLSGSDAEYFLDRLGSLVPEPRSRPGDVTGATVIMGKPADPVPIEER